MAAPANTLAQAIRTKGLQLIQPGPRSPMQQVLAQIPGTTTGVPANKLPIQTQQPAV